VSSALKKNRDQRLPSAAEFAAGLNSIAQKVRDRRTALEPVTVTYAAPVAAPAAIPAKPQLIVPAPKPPAVISPVPEPPTVVARPLPALPASPPLPQPVVAKPALAAIRTAAQAPVRKPLPVPAILRKRMIPIAIAGLLAIGLFGTLLSRQNSQASQPKTAAPAVELIPAVPSAAVSAPPVSVPSQPVEIAPPQPAPPTSAVAPIVEVMPAPEVILRGQVKSLWEAGKYSQALTLVDRILADNPALPEARAWKKKIRAAQEAEAAIK
jgi:hypothetical protein